jgi:hypothetical protein
MVSTWKFAFRGFQMKMMSSFWPIFARRLFRGATGKWLVAAVVDETDDGLPPFCGTEFEASNVGDVDGWGEEEWSTFGTGGCGTGRSIMISSPTLSTSSPSKPESSSSSGRSSSPSLLSASSIYSIASSVTANKRSAKGILILSGCNFNKTLYERISTDRNVPKCILELFERSFDSPRSSRNPTTTKQRDSLKTRLYLVATPPSWIPTKFPKVAITAPILAAIELVRIKMWIVQANVKSHSVTDRRDICVTWHKNKNFAKTKEQMRHQKH